jgi:hypothetical protein
MRPIDQNRRLLLAARLLATRDAAAVRRLGRLYQAARLRSLAAALGDALAAGRWEAIQEHAQGIAGA